MQVPTHLEGSRSRSNPRNRTEDSRPCERGAERICTPLPHGISTNTCGGSCFKARELLNGNVIGRDTRASALQTESSGKSPLETEELAVVSVFPAGMVVLLTRGVGHSWPSEGW